MRAKAVVFLLASMGANSVYASTPDTLDSLLEGCITQPQENRCSSLELLQQFSNNSDPKNLPVVEAAQKVIGAEDFLSDAELADDLETKKLEAELKEKLAEILEGLEFEGSSGLDQKQVQNLSGKLLEHLNTTGAAPGADFDSDITSFLASSTEFKSLLDGGTIDFSSALSSAASSISSALHEDGLAAALSKSISGPQQEGSINIMEAVDLDSGEISNLYANRQTLEADSISDVASVTREAPKFLDGSTLGAGTELDDGGRPVLIADEQATDRSERATDFESSSSLPSSPNTSNSKPSSSKAALAPLGAEHGDPNATGTGARSDDSDPVSRTLTQTPTDSSTTVSTPTSEAVSPTPETEDPPTPSPALTDLAAQETPKATPSSTTPGLSDEIFGPPEPAADIKAQQVATPTPVSNSGSLLQDYFDVAETSTTPASVAQRPGPFLSDEQLQRNILAEVMKEENPASLISPPLSYVNDPGSRYSASAVIGNPAFVDEYAKSLNEQQIANFVEAQDQEFQDKYAKKMKELNNNNNSTESQNNAGVKRSLTAKEEQTLNDFIAKKDHDLTGIKSVKSDGSVEIEAPNQKEVDDWIGSDTCFGFYSSLNGLRITNQYAKNSTNDYQSLSEEKFCAGANLLWQNIFGASEQLKREGRECLVRINAIKKSAKFVRSGLKDDFSEGALETAWRQSKEPALKVAFAEDMFVAGLSNGQSEGKAYVCNSLMKQTGDESTLNRLSKIRQEHLEQERTGSCKKGAENSSSIHSSNFIAESYQSALSARSLDPQSSSEDFFKGFTATYFDYKNVEKELSGSGLSPTAQTALVISGKCGMVNLFCDQQQKIVIGGLTLESMRAGVFPGNVDAHQSYMQKQYLQALLKRMKTQGTLSSSCQVADLDAEVKEDLLSEKGSANGAPHKRTQASPLPSEAVKQ